MQPWLEIFFRQEFPRCLTESISERREVLLANGEPGRHFMAAKFLQVFLTTVERFDKRQSFNAPPAPLPQSRRIKGDQDRGTIIFSRESGSHDAEHPWMPVPRAEDDRRVARRIELVGQFLFRFVVNRSLDRLAIAVL